MRGAECNTGHQLLRVRMRISKLCQTKKPASTTHRFDVSKLAGASVEENGKITPKGHFHELASKLVRAVEDRRDS